MPDSGVPGGLQAQALIPFVTDPFSIIKGTHSDIGPLEYLYTNWAFETAPEYNTIAGDELFIYHPKNHPAILPKERLIAYNVRSGYWRDWHLENEPDMLSQLAASGAVSAWVGGERYFAFVSPYPITGNTPQPSIVSQPDATVTPVPPPAVSAINADNAGTWASSEWLLQPTPTSTSTLYVYRYYGGDGGDIGYDTSTSTWVDVGSSHPFSVNHVGAIVTLSSPAYPILARFTDPYY